MKINTVSQKILLVSVLLFLMLPLVHAQNSFNPFDSAQDFNPFKLLGEGLRNVFGWDWFTAENFPAVMRGMTWLMLFIIYFVAMQRVSAYWHITNSAIPVAMAVALATISVMIFPTSLLILFSYNWGLIGGSVILIAVWIYAMKNVGTLSANPNVQRFSRGVVSLIIAALMWMLLALLQQGSDFLAGLAAQSGARFIFALIPVKLFMEKRKKDGN
ncbi:hypothetical protein J4475_01040 [Candidatus Woesearchaeota archaeon]|nr:hypothetical protein [Candidatus Woesearchaeota archaeon]